MLLYVFGGLAVLLAVYAASTIMHRRDETRRDDEASPMVLSVSRNPSKMNVSELISQKSQTCKHVKNEYIIL